MARKEVIPEVLFYNEVTHYIKTHFLNADYKYYLGPKVNHRDPYITVDEVIREVQKNAQNLLDKIEGIKHLINLNEDNTLINWEKESGSK